MVQDMGFGRSNEDEDATQPTVYEMEVERRCALSENQESQSKLNKSTLGAQTCLLDARGS
jgi:hypothetical protein